MSISAKEVMKLRQATGAGMMDCKKALQESGGDYDAAMDYLRKKGLKTAEKRAGRDANEGKVVAVIADDGRSGVLLELNSETDFVAGTDDFKTFAQDCAKAALAKDPADAEALLALDGLNDRLNEMTGKLGEKIGIRRFSRVALPEGTAGRVHSYIHLGDKHGVLVHVTCDKAESAASEELQTLVNDICLQIVAYQPQALGRDDMDASVIEKEREVYRDIARNEGKPEQIIDKIAEGKLNKFFAETTLLEQAFVKEDKQSVQQHVNSVAKGLGDKITVGGFENFVIGA